MYQRPSPKIPVVGQFFLPTAKIPANSMILGDQSGGMPVLTGKHIRISIGNSGSEIGDILPLVKIGHSRSMYSAVNLAVSVSLFPIPASSVKSSWERQ
jgi:hypothetical protein